MLMRCRKDLALLGAIASRRASKRKARDEKRGAMEKERVTLLKDTHAAHTRRERKTHTNTRTLHVDDLFATLARSPFALARF